MKENIVEIFTDGACTGNPGPGGWCAILRYKKHEKILSGFEQNTTNNKMELTAIIKALEIIKRPSKIRVYSDSQYLIKGMTEWLPNWIKRGWKNSKKEEVQNKELWVRLCELSEKHEIEWIWIKGHEGHPENEKCDKIAKDIINKTKINKK
ncbi:MAG: ribonuclease HI [Proteobacteria bacterium]|nr:ribonuclease HI [Pseudomonadota bacterium]